MLFCNNNFQFKQIKQNNRKKRYHLCVHNQTYTTVSYVCVCVCVCLCDVFLLLMFIYITDD